MEVDLVGPASPRIVRDLILKDHIDTIIYVAADHQRHLLLWIAANFSFFLMQHIEHGDRIDERSRLCRRRLQCHR